MISLLCHVLLIDTLNFFANQERTLKRLQMVCVEKERLHQVTAKF